MALNSKVLLFFMISDIFLKESSVGSKGNAFGLGLIFFKVVCVHVCVTYYMSNIFYISFTYPTKAGANSQVTASAGSDSI